MNHAEREPEGRTINEMGWYRFAFPALISICIIHLVIVAHMGVVYRYTYLANRASASVVDFVSIVGIVDTTVLLILLGWRRFHARNAGWNLTGRNIYLLRALFLVAALWLACSEVAIVYDYLCIVPS